MSIDQLIRQAIIEDVGDGDHTSLASIPENAQGKAQLIVKENGIIAGIEAARMVFSEIDPRLKFERNIPDGTPVIKGDIAFYISGKTRSILQAERLSLNILQRMSGIATYTRYLLGLIEGYPCRILDTRKTTPNFRVFEKWAVKIGGGENHRMGLYDMVMLKDNHIDYAGGIEKAVLSVKEYLQNKKKNLEIVVEARNLDEVNEILRVGGVDRILLDNFSVAEMEKAVSVIGDLCETEASGGITEETIRSYAATGVTYISVGALTHQIKSLDLSLKAL